MLLIAGGWEDPNIITMQQAALRHLQLSHVLWNDPKRPRIIEWRPGDSALSIDGVALWPGALFLRYDVFSWLGKDVDGLVRDAASAWYETVLGWALANPSVRMFNRRSKGNSSKPANLQLAVACGLAIPESKISNAIAGLNPEEWVIKPVAGGAHTQPMPSGEQLVMPMIIQRRLHYPECRLFRVGDELFAFRLESKSLDHRDDAGVDLQPMAVPPELAQPMLQLAEELGLDYAAADFKTCPKSGRWLFLEMNTMPMYAAFDKAAGGKLVAAMLRWLCR